MNLLRTFLPPLLLILLSSAVSAAAVGGQLSEQDSEQDNVQNSVEADAILGYWVMPDGSALLKVTEAAAGQFSVTIKAVLDDHYSIVDGESLRGQRRLDRHNPNKKLRTQSLVGLQIGSGFEFDSASQQWRGGHLYDPVSGNSYQASLALAPDGYLKVRGFVGISLLGRTMYWSRGEDFNRRIKAMLTELQEPQP